MKKLFNETNLNENVIKAMGVKGMLNRTISTVGVNKMYEDTQMNEAFIVNGNALGYGFKEIGLDAGEKMFKSFVASVSTYLGMVKVANEKEAVALVLTSTDGKFKFAGIVEYHENADSKEPGNWSYVLTLNESDLEAVSKKKNLKKYLCGDDSFKNVFGKVAYDVGHFEFDEDLFMYDACIITIDTLIGVLSNEAKEGETVEIEMPGFFVASVEVEGAEKVMAIVPDGSMKELIKSDLSIEK